MSSYEATKIENEATPLTASPVLKQGHSFCGGCCDVRRATIIVNIIMIAFNVIGIVAMIEAFAATGQAVEGIDDDEVLSSIAAFHRLPIRTFIIVYVVESAFFACGIYGAVKYKAGFVMTAFVVYCLAAIFALLSLNIPGLILSALFAYPHYFLYKEIKSGIMSEETYAVEKQSCCCV